ncbi:hypothetical protein T310_8882, partial [Rasamsonia emersonii CBS 393.64]
VVHVGGTGTGTGDLPALGCGVRWIDLRFLPFLVLLATVYLIHVFNFCQGFFFRAIPFDSTVSERVSLMGTVFCVYEGPFCEQECSRNPVERVEQHIGIFRS